jgi:hypothetical protein
LSSPFKGNIHLLSGWRLYHFGSLRAVSKTQSSYLTSSDTLASDLLHELKNDVVRWQIVQPRLKAQGKCKSIENVHLEKKRIGIYH